MINLWDKLELLDLFIHSFLTRSFGEPRVYVGCGVWKTLGQIRTASDCSCSVHPMLNTTECGGDCSFRAGWRGKQE